MWSAESNQKNSEFSVSSFGGSVPEVVKRSPPEVDDAEGAAGPGTPGNDHDVYCGLLGLYPEFLQAFRTPFSYLVCICVLGMTQGFVVNGLVSVVTPTIEKRFQLLGIESGMILSMFNVASCIMVMPVSYYGGVGHKPVIMGIGGLVMSTGSMVFSSPHFLAPQYMAQDASSSGVCPERGPGKCTGASATHSIRSYKYYFMLGHALHGIGSSPFFTLGVAYLDQNTPSDKVSLYMGIFYATSVLGPAMGFLLGAFFLSKYTDITVDSAQLGITSSSNTWVGAWWLGFFGASIATFLTALPMASFPRFLPNPEHAPSSRRASATVSPAAAGATPEGQGAPSPGTAVLSPDQSQRSLVNHMKRLISNPTFVCLTFAASAEAMIASGLTGFATKIFISMFGISSTRASSLLGMVAVPSACGGTVLGGYAITKLNVKSSSIVRYCAILALVPWFTLFVFLQSCPSKQSAVVNLTAAADAQRLIFGDLERSCNAHCNCTGVVYNPVCGSDNLTYYSPCIAGCAEVRRYKKTKLYSQCTCVNGPTLHMAGEAMNDTGYDYMAKREPCDADCGLVFIYAGAIFVALFFTFLLVVPALTAMLRSLEEDIKSTGIGVNYVLMRMFGTIPGPIVFGHLIDRSCLLWQSTCSGGTGACAIYENSAMGTNLFRVMVVVKSAAIMFFFCASLSTKSEASNTATHSPHMRQDSDSPMSGATVPEGEAGESGGAKDQGDSPDRLAKGDRGDDGDDKLLSEDASKN
ncbi:hypothetical protein HPB50_009622 [Hyalomma asiaticum]|uniref:Uncharacterized protein n=1 Tax=Hyalomma asiaticum TaxID=266040 RepID=A0ACB7S4L9_HYAAI|nr:hypothetical protein HPB50_009622 [Hyalomma asiaticum]